MRSATIFLTLLLFCAATDPANAQSPSSSHEILPVGEQTTVEGSSIPTTALLPLHVQPGTRETIRVGVSPLPLEPPRRKATPLAAFEEAVVPSKAEQSETVPQTQKAATDGPVGFSDHYATTVDSALSIPGRGWRLGERPRPRR